MTAYEQIRDFGKPLRTSDICRIRNCSGDAVRNAQKSGQLQATRVGTDFRFEPAAVLAWMTQENKAGHWVWQGDVLVHEEPHYEIAASRLRNLQELSEWTEHLARKAWVSKGTITNLIQKFVQRQEQLQSDGNAEACCVEGEL